jgi:hypothetical protein
MPLNIKAWIARFILASVMAVRVFVPADLIVDDCAEVRSRPMPGMF